MFADHRDIGLGGELIGRQADRRRGNRRELRLYRGFPSVPKQSCNEVTKNLIDIKVETERIARGDINEAYV